MLCSHCLMFSLYKYPLPPSSNELYASVRGRLIKTKIARLYDYEVQNYYLNNINMFNDLRLFVKDSLISVDCIFIFHKKRIISKENKVKKLDASNRLKICHDTLAKILDIDDKQIVRGSFEKATCDSENDERVIIHINKCNSIKSYQGKGVLNETCTTS